MNGEFIEALNDLEKEKQISKDVLLDTIELALVSAYKRNYGAHDNVRVKIDRESGDVEVLMRKDIVADEDFEDEIMNITLTEAQQIDPRYDVGDSIEFSVMPKSFGRIAAQTAKQVVVQRIREAERNKVFDEFSTRQGEILTGSVQRKSGNTLFISLGKSEGILSANEQVPGEFYEVRDRLKVYIMDVKKTNRGPQVFLSRSHPGLVKGLFELEVPEIQDEIVEIKGVAREAGSRTKMAVYSSDENVDPVGACVGTRGSRVQMVVDELGGEKIDIISWSEDPAELIKNVLSPAEVEDVIINDEEERIATAVVPDYQLSLAIGRQGQNVRLAAKVSGWKIDIKSHTAFIEGPEEEEVCEENEDILISEEKMETVFDEAVVEAESEAETDVEAEVEAEVENEAEVEAEAETEAEAEAEVEELAVFEEEAEAEELAETPEV